MFFLSVNFPDLQFHAFVCSDPDLSLQQQPLTCYPDVYMPCQPH